jgi:hypothetical protein
VWAISPCRLRVASFVAGLAGVVAGVEMHGDVLGQRTEIVEGVQGGCRQWRVVSVRPGQYPALWSAVALGRAGTVSCFACVGRLVGPPATSPPPGVLVMHPSTVMSSRFTPMMRS